MLLGEASVGKTALVNRFIHDREPEKSATSTIGVEFSKRTMTIDGKQI